jgi:lysozyme
MTLLDQLKRDEGLRLTPYRDSVGKLTIGYGRNLDAEGISADEAEYMLHNDLIAHTQALEKALPWVTTLDQARHDALVNIAFNVGVPGLLEFKKTLALIQAGEYSLAAEELMRSKWATQVGVRAERLSAQLRIGVYQ